MLPSEDNGYTNLLTNITTMQSDLNGITATLDKLAKVPVAPSTGVDTVGAEEMLQGLVNSANALANHAPTAAATSLVDPNVASVLDTTVGNAKMGLHGAALGETLGEALLKLPHDLTDWIGHLGLGDWLHTLTSSLTGVMSGGLLHWIMVGFLGLRIFTVGRTLLTPGQRGRGPVSLVYYQIAQNTVEPVVAYLRNSAQIEVREINQAGEQALIGVPVYHQGKMDRALAYLKQKTGLAYVRI